MNLSLREQYQSCRHEARSQFRGLRLPEWASGLGSVCRKEEVWGTQVLLTAKGRSYAGHSVPVLWVLSWGQGHRLSHFPLQNTNTHNLGRGGYFGSWLQSIAAWQGSGVGAPRPRSWHDEDPRTWVRWPKGRIPEEILAETCLRHSSLLRQGLK